ncbi:TetR/AcrR family transcriptional regulator [Patulibacter brassicae]|jgi:AcrR family transcriptional regulator|uniref:TetR/AcrR family transcriptional regulator n=1 Tax=Patulibacter brassicae TaxID=1705717 RepID=A0ABU4VQ39_9ACTN|nr:TetR/AcrR family transcriptional regulator [Patulibacter brassicae]MDX8153749.1 TetR/AcrR family transcriptional regulator [Patulibacter brassicae]
MPSVTRKRQGSRADRREEIRKKLLAVIERLLEEGESFTEISVERMVSEAGVSRSTFYVYFEDKGDLLTAWFEEIRAELTEAAKEWWTLDASATRDDVQRVLDNIVRTYQPHTVLMAATYDAAAYDANVRELVTAMMRNNVAGLRRHIVAGQKGGFVAEGLIPTQTSGWLTWMAERGFHQLVRRASPAELEKLIEAYTDIVWNTLYAPARQG